MEQMANFRGNCRGISLAGIKTKRVYLWILCPLLTLGLMVFWTTPACSQFVITGLELAHVESLVIDPINPNKIYAGTNYGVFKSKDGGISWIRMSAGLPETHCTWRLAIDSVNTKNIYAGGPSGVFKSSDGGKNWAGTNITIHTLSMAFQHTGGYVYAGTKDMGVFRSADGGASWENASSDMTASLINCIAPNPLNGLVVYTGTMGGVYKTVNSCNNWVKIASLEIDFGNPNPVRAIAIDPLNRKNIYAATQGGIFKSTNAGESWTLTSSTSATVFFNSLAINPTNPNIIYAGSNKGLYKSGDGGQSWKLVPGLAGKHIHSLAIDPVNTNATYAGTTQGVFKRASDGQ